MTAQVESKPDEPQAAGGDGAPSTPPGSPRFAWEVWAHVKRWLKKPPDDTSQRLWTCLLITLFVDFLAAFYLGAGEFKVAREQTFVFFAALGAGVLIVIALANLWALISVGSAAQSWGRDAFIAQLFVFFLALYIAWVSFQSSPPSLRATWLSAVALTFSLVALVWLLLLWGRAALQWKAAAILGALVPIVGAGQFWLQNFYIPQTTAPLVDFSANLSPQGRDGSTNHFSAKITVHNRGAVAVRVAGALMRVTAYEKEASPQSQDISSECPGWNGSYNWQCVQQFLDLSGNSYNKDFRADHPTLAKNAKPVYTGLLMPGPRYALNPGDTQYFQRAVDINSDVRLVRLSVSAVFLTIRTISDVRSCDSTAVSLDSNPQEFVEKVREPVYLGADNKPVSIKDQQQQQVVSHVLCKDYEIARTNIVDKLIGARPVIRVMVVLDDSHHPDLEYPQLDYWYGFAGEGDQFSRADPRIGQKMAAVNPAAVYKDVSVECASGDQPKCDEKVQAGELPPVTTHRP
jgi:hypothetical protein